MLLDILLRAVILLLFFSSIFASPPYRVCIIWPRIFEYMMTDLNAQKACFRLTSHKQKNSVQHFAAREYETYLKASHSDDYVLPVNTTFSVPAIDSSFVLEARRVPGDLVTRRAMTRSLADPLVPGPVFAFIIVLALGTCMF
ncbi:hypothetical protein BCR43DRAFT_494612 [Syncephalastrum racemosum]|uniref:Uncharacterized protein n=1 Tax=Syncephalastrum racemosum TaxID=13706 RepID=A0A1X2H896_SYNRA|nr:hypothetical protein BCR43DRAFT_494612 [Syncephalastrum racemosum]